MTECVAQTTLEFYKNKPIVVGFEAPHTSSDGGSLLLRQADERLGLSRWFADALPDNREASKVDHDRREQVRQRMFQIALGYEDCNDADTLRDDPVLQVACERDAGAPLSSQPTLSRFENAVDMKTIKRLLVEFEKQWVAGLAGDTEVVVLDIDTTDDTTHGNQQLSFFHGYYDHYIYHPMLIFDGEGELVSAILRPGNTHSARGAACVLDRIVRRVRARFPEAQIVIRGDAGFGIGRLLQHFDQLDDEIGGVAYVCGIAKNDALLRLAEPALAQAEQRFRQTGIKVKDLHSGRYAAQSWKQDRRLVIKAEHSTRGSNPRFVVTNIEQIAPEMIYHAYCQRGRCENMIKDFKNALRADRLSCSRFVTNFFRLLLHAGAYRLMTALRRAAAAVGSDLGSQQFDTVRLRLLKVAAVVGHSVRRVLVQLPCSFPCANVFRAIARYQAAAIT